MLCWCVTSTCKSDECSYKTFDSCDGPFLPLCSSNLRHINTLVILTDHPTSPRITLMQDTGHLPTPFPLVTYPTGNPPQNQGTVLTAHVGQSRGWLLMITWLIAGTPQIILRRRPTGKSVGTLLVSSTFLPTVGQTAGCHLLGKAV